MNDPDLSFDIDALFEHMGCRDGLSDELDWVFMFQSRDVPALEAVAHTLEDEFMVQVQEDVEIIDEAGNSTAGDPLLSVVSRGAKTADEVKAIADRMSRIADEHGLIYDGVECYDPADLDEIFGWLEPDDAFWRLRHMTDIGLEDNDELPWCFLILSPDANAMKRVLAKLAERGFADCDSFDEPDDEGVFHVCAFVAGRNNEAELAETIETIAQIAERESARLGGVQFYTREELYEVFSDDDDDDDDV